MKVKNLVKLFVIASFMAAGSVYAQGITNTFHDLSYGNTTFSGAGLDNSVYGNKICKFCHTPHNATADITPLWNRATPTGPFDMYTSDTMDMTVDAAPSAYSMACLSCHDGTIAIDSMVNMPYKYTSDGTHKITGEYNLGQDLSNDHPISITYDNSAAGDEAFYAAVDGEVGGLPLYNGKMECSSCHDVHNFYPYAPFLRADNTRSAMCLTCHIK